MQTYRVQIEPKLSERLEQAARAAKIGPAELIAQCVEQHLDIALRYVALLDRLDTVDQGLLDLAGLVGEASAGRSVEVSSICRYSPPKV
ncbi:hypothetical protein WN73_19075 [Bradyrhizobium sp. CCBAU 45394]|uniref:hypothetical protein n=1 Tax=Bradyrhizobium sp. CCBAU 45394 TaxID=1325087 RepID=UPI002303B715|nr:hypothetical protein [Bradyrhizobium sp. CCBAU 45394]MDA9392631.1 hypothetical protein [Bradyrhizobium sp. CCBAU 45394]